MMAFGIGNLEVYWPSVLGLDPFLITHQHILQPSGFNCSLPDAAQSAQSAERPLGYFQYSGTHAVTDIGP